MKDSTHIELRDEVPLLQLFDGVAIRPVLGIALNIQEVILEPGAEAPIHTHDEEQLGYVVSGRCHFTDGDRHWELGPGDFYRAPPGARHGATALSEGCVIIDAFSPPRAQVVEMMAKR